jgi:hypothetical protein
MVETKELKIGVGALAPPIPQQLKEQGFKFDKYKANHFEKLRECITHLKFSEILNESQWKKAYEKLYRKIHKHINEKNKPN